MYLGKPRAVGGDNRDIARLRVGVVDGCVLLDTELQRDVGSGRGTGIFPNILPYNDMVGNVEGGRHFDGIENC